LRQDYWLEHQGTKKRMLDEPVHKPKAVVFGPTIVYDAERCIVCTRDRRGRRARRRCRRCRLGRRLRFADEFLCAAGEQQHCRGETERAYRGPDA
jgi:hypothetical protein